MVATGSSLFNSAFCDAICVALLELRGYSVDDFGETHPGGAVGHKIRENDSHVKAARLTGPETIELVDLPDPRLPRGRRAAAR